MFNAGTGTKLRVRFKGPILGTIVRPFMVVQCFAMMFSVGNVWSAPPTLTNVFPAGGERGSKLTVKCAGSFTWPVKVWSPGIDAIPSTESGRLEVSIPVDLAADRVWIRLYNSEGASALLPFLIGSLKELSEVEPNSRPRDAQVITDSELTINGVLTDADVDCFAVTLKAGQTLVAAVDANTRLGSPMDAILQVVSQDGIVVAENHDDLGLDPRLIFTPTAPGTYVIRMFAFPAAPDASIRFNGGANHIYRLTLTTGPYVTHPIPLSTSLTEPATVAVAGWNLPPGIKLNVLPSGGERLADSHEYEVQDELRRSSDATLGFAFTPDFSIAARVRMTSHAVVTNHSVSDPKVPLKLSLSSSVTGCLKAPRQVDRYIIRLEKGQQVLISVEARSHYLPLDPVLILSSPEGKVFAEVDDTGSTRDGLIAHTAAQSGDYQLSVSDRFRQGGDRNWYLLTVRPEQPDFELNLTSDAIIVAPDKPAEITLKIQRRGSSAESVGPIAIQATGLPDGVVSTPVVSETTGATASEVKLIVSSIGPAYSGPFRIVGRADQPRTIERYARTPSKLGVQFQTIWLTAIEKP
jgi:Bacterial pre-peptidase C-terminal domain